MLPFGRYQALRSAGPEEALHSIRTRQPLLREFMPRGRTGSWKIDINEVKLGDTRVIASSTSAMSLLNAEDGFMRIFLPLNSSFEICSEGTSAVCSPQSAWIACSDYRGNFPDEARAMMAIFPVRLIADMLDELGVRLDIHATLSAAFKSGKTNMPGFREHLLALARAFRESPFGILDERRFRHAHQELLLLQTTEFFLRGFEQQARSAPGPFARAIDFMQAHLSDEIGPTAIAAAAGCSLRNLQLLFRQQMNVTITESLRDMRLTAARERLRAPKENDSITGIAMECGFSHMSDFARHYKRVFGERPSQTLALSRLG